MGHGLMERDAMISVNSMPWHRHKNAVVLDKPPASVDEALVATKLTWKTGQGDVLIALPMTAEVPGAIYVPQLEAQIIPAKEFMGNLREDTWDVLGIVGADYKVVENREAFVWLEDLIGGEIEIETAGSLGNGKRVWVLARVPDYLEVGGDETAPYIYCANSHDGSMAVTAAWTTIRIVCANTLNWALAQSEGGPRTYKFRHTGDLQSKLGEARKVMEIGHRWLATTKEMGDRLATQRMSLDRFQKKVARPLIGFTEEAEAEMRGKERKIAIRNREDSMELLSQLFVGKGPEGDTSGNSPGTKWTAVNAVAEYADHHRRTTKRTDQVARSFEDAGVKQRGLELVLDA